MNGKYQDIAQQVLELARQKGASQGEVFLLDGEELTIEVANQQVENLKLAQERGLGFRVLAGQNLGYSFTSDLSTSALAKVVEMAIHNAGYAEPDPNWELPKAVTNYPSMDLFDEHTSKVAMEEKIRLAQRVEEAARAADPRITITEKSVYHDSQYSVNIYNTNGLAISYRGSYCGAYTVVVGQENGESQTGLQLQYELKYNDLDPESIGKTAGLKAVRMLGARSVSSARLPIVLEPYTATSFLGVLQTAFSGEAVLKGKSFLHGRVGQQVVSPLLSIIDDGTLVKRLGSSPFDGEGVPTQETILVRDGILQGFLHNTYTARKSGVPSTGNGVRGTYKSTPEVGITNFYLQNGSTASGKVISDVERGLLITEVMGMHTANPITGDFSLGASGLLIENGQITRPVKGIAIAGNLQEILMDIEAVGDDLTFFVGKGSPSLRIGAMSISGS